MKVETIFAYYSEEPLVAVYDLTVEGTHLYFANGVLVSNSKRVSLLDMNALLSSGATENLRDKGLIRGQRNEDYWLQFMSGYTPREPKVPLVYEKFVNQLKASGINVVRKGQQLHVMALTDKDVKLLAGDRMLRSGETVNFDRELKPVPGGLFDPQLTGGHGGKSWSTLPLEEPMLNPVFEEPARRILGLTQKKFLEVIGGEHHLEKFGTGPEAIAKALDAINLPREIALAHAQWKNGSKSARDTAVRKWGYLKSAQALDVHPRDWIMSKVPVLPPIFRPVSLMGDSGIPLVSDANYLYRELFNANSNLKEMKGELGDEGVGHERAALYHAFKAVTGLGDPVHPKLVEKGVKGILQSIFGTSPKYSVLQRKLLSSTVDNVGRAVIVPNPNYDMDTIGLPEDKAYDVYQKFLVRRMHRRGLPIREALKQVRDRTQLAKAALQEEMQERPVIVNRAPVLHKFGIMAFRPELVKGDVLHFSPLVLKGFNADFDGDKSQFHVPSSEEAVKEAYDRLLPSRNLISPADMKTPMHTPGQEFVTGLYAATTARSQRRPRVFRSKQDALAAIRRHELDPGDPIEVLEG